MSDIDSDTDISIFIDKGSKAETAALALIAHGEFDRARICVPALAAYADYEDWLNNREGFQIGLAMAGVAVKMVPVALKPFLIWCGLTRTTPTERSLDAFAVVLLALRNPPPPVVLAVVRRPEFQAYVQRSGAFAQPDGYERWTKHREDIRERFVASGARIEELPVSVDEFLAWSECLGEGASEAALDRYAELLLEYLSTDIAH